MPKLPRPVSGMPNEFIVIFLAAIPVSPSTRIRTKSPRPLSAGQQRRQQAGNAQSQRGQCVTGNQPAAEQR